MSLPEGVTIKEGAFYRTRDGLTVGPFIESWPDDRLRGGEGPRFCLVVGDGRYWLHDGKAFAGFKRAEHCDLTARVSDPTLDKIRAYVESAAAPALLPTDSQVRKDTPIYSGVLAYFPRAMAYIAQVSKVGNDKHNPGQPLHWSKGKSNDHADCVARHLIEHGTVDPDDGLLHSGKLAWRALALLETELENAAK